MALIKCPNCGHEISDKAIQCPKCKAYQDENKSWNKLSVKEIIRDGKKMRHLGIVLIIIFIILIIIFALLASRSSTNTGKKKYAGYADEQLKMTDEKKIEKISKLFGKKSEDGSINCSQNFVDFINELTLFGYDVEITPIISNGKYSDSGVDCIRGNIEDGIEKNDLNNIVENLCDLYGKYDVSNSNYDEIKKGYQWTSADDYSLIACGMNGHKDEIIIYWVK